MTSAPATSPASPAWPSRGVKARLKFLLFALLPAALLVAFFEGFATLAIARRASLQPDSAGGGTIYRMRIGRFPWSRASVTPLNRDGFPDRDFPGFSDKGNCVHVVFAGDSYVFGDGVDRDSNLVERLRRRTVGRAPCVRLFNIAERGTTIDRQANHIRATLATLQPDIVILGQYQNDLIDLTNPGAILDTVRGAPGQPEGDSIRVRLRIFKPNIVRLLSYHAFAWMIKHRVERDFLRHWSVLADTTRRAEAGRLMGLYGALFDSLANELQARNIAFGTLIIPSKFDVLAARYPEEPYFAGLAERRNLPFLRTFPILDGRRSPYLFLMYDGHLNARGNGVLADAVYDWLFTAEPAPFQGLRGRPIHPNS